MTVAATVRKAGPTPGNSLATVFPFAFKVFVPADIRVQQTVIATGVISVLVLNDPLGYTVALNPDQNANPGGSITYNPLGVPMPATLALTIDSVVPQVQGTHIINGGSFFANNIEDAVDKVLINVQDLAAKVASSVQFPSVDSAALNAILPAAALRANLVLGFDALGNVIVTSGGSNIPISAAMTAVVQAATLALGRAALGFSAFFDTLITAANKAAFTALITPLTTKGDLWGFAAADARLAVGSNGQALLADSSQASGLIYIDNPARPNALINPNWQIDQINEGALYTVNGLDIRGPDGLSGTAVGVGVFKLRTVADPDHASLKAVEITCTTVDAAIAAADDYFLYMAVEGYDAAALLYGEAGAKAGTFQFDFKSNVNGTYGVSVANSAGTRRYVGSIVVADANEHTYSLSFTADQAGAWLFTSGVGMSLRICLAAGANFQTVAPLAWAAGAEQTVAAQVNFMSNVANVAYLKRVQFIPGALVQAYRPADIQKELAKAQRYYEKSYNNGVVPATNTIVGLCYVQVSAALATGFGAGTVYFKNTKRTVPTMALYSRAGSLGIVSDGNQADYAAGGFNFTGPNTGSLQNTSAGNWTPPGNSVTFHYTAECRLS